MKVAVVTGANKGLGFGIVRGLCKRFDGDVILTARNESRGKEAIQTLEKEGLHPKFHQLDITDHDSIVRLRDYLQNTYQGLDVLVNNAAIAYQFNGSVAPPYPEEVREVCHTNYFSVVDVCQVLFPLLRPHARVCNVSSVSCHESFYGCSTVVQNRIKNAMHTIEDVNQLIRDFVEAAQKDQAEKFGFDRFPYGMSKVGISLMSAIQQKTFDQTGAEDIIVNCCDVGAGGWVATDMTNHYGVSVDKGALNPLFCALLPPNVDGPKGKFLYDEEEYDWWNLDLTQVPGGFTETQYQ
ncbi:carbonyl reductase [NADPH] 1 [Plakobranchus ocellatus]|uniref:Carbonyl reductase [NADPH] 1 n=1 Tax=Plakobranchus ocellatus TaxID=259542 RepID=A0AAV3YH21_9GAST|nr:carbonyl reductase [NADPH] 1 [Plakobranchus ocellatus]